MAPQLTVKEQAMVDDIVRAKQDKPMEAVQKINAERRKRKVEEVHKSTVYRYIDGATHARGRTEKRGRKQALTKADTQKLQQSRRRLLKKADGEYRVTYADIIKEAGLDEKVCQRTCMDALREKNVRYRAPRRKVMISQEDAKKRLKVAKD
jgi:hypothetical protein